MLDNRFIRSKDFVTLASAGSGFAALLAAPSCLQALELPASAWLIALAVLLDGLDGRVARKRGHFNDFGRELDSLADGISFGAAPAVFLFYHARQAVAIELLLAACAFFLACALIRLAKFNLQEDKKFFYGLPSPAAALALVVLTLASPLAGVAGGIALGFAMTAAFKIPKI